MLLEKPLSFRGLEGTVLYSASQRGHPDSRSGPANLWEVLESASVTQKPAANSLALEGFHPTSIIDSFIQSRKRGVCSKPWPNLESS